MTMKSKKKTRKATRETSIRADLIGLVLSTLKGAEMERRANPDRAIRLSLAAFDILLTLRSLQRREDSAG